MNGIHDVGGMDGLGVIAPTPAEPVFAADWERTAFGMLTVALGVRAFNLDEVRHAIEGMSPMEYFGTPYYEHWLHAAEDRLVAHGVLGAEELAERTRLFREEPDTPIPDVSVPELLAGLETAIRTPMSAARELDRTRRFTEGDPVVVRNEHPKGHTRAPRYVRGRTGVVQRALPAYLLPDAHAHGGTEDPHFLYSVRFDAAELWGASTGDPTEAVYVDLFEPYLDPTGAIR